MKRKTLLFALTRSVHRDHLCLDPAGHLPRSIRHPDNTIVSGSSGERTGNSTVTNLQNVVGTMFLATNYARTQAIVLPANAGFLRVRRN